MSTQTTEYLEAVDRLPPGGMLIFRNVAWEDYEEFLINLDDRPGVRVSYDEGRLEIMSPLPDHDYYGRFIVLLLHLIADQLNLDIDSYGTTTWRKKSIQKGVEADESFYIGTRLADRLHIDLQKDPPPDLVVEIDTTAESSRKFPIYAALQVPEIWQYDGNTMRFYVLSENSYVEIIESRCLSGIKPGMITAALEQSRQSGQTAALRAFRHDVQKQ